MSAFLNLASQIYGKLTVIKRIGTRSGSPLWLCKCSCGKYTEVNTRSLRSSNTKSCGCIHSEQLAQRNKDNSKHGGHLERLYGVWHGMKQRCYDKNRSDYKNYGGRGIKICKEWINDYEAFRKWALNNGYNPHAQYGECTLDRIDNDGNYTPANCRWVDAKTQANNRRKVELN